MVRTEQPKLRQCAFSVAGASATSVGARARGDDLEAAGNGDGSRRWNVGGGGQNGGCLCRSSGSARWRQRRGGVDGAMWKVETVLMAEMEVMEVCEREQEEADRWSLFVLDLIENCRCCAACRCRVRAGIACSCGCGKVISNAEDQNTSDTVIERNVTDLCWLGNNVTVSCSSVILEYANAGRELQKKAMQREALADADCLQQNIRRPFILMQLVESRVGQDRRVSLCDPRFYSAAFKNQVGDRSGRRGTSFYSSG